MSTRRVVVIAGPTRVAERIRAQGRALDVIEAESFLAAIPLVAEPGTHAVLAGIDHGPRRLEAAVAGLREAAGPDMRIILCCRPYAEPVARGLVRMAGQPDALKADDYVIDPPTADELQAALRLSEQDERLAGAEPAVGIPAESEETGLGERTPSAGLGIEELGLLTDVLAHIHAKPGEFLNRLAWCVQTALQADGVEMVAYGHAVRKGVSVEGDRLVEPLVADGGRIGQVTVGYQRPDDLRAVQVARLRRYAQLCAQALSAHRREAQARNEALTDPVSGLYNRRYLDQVLPGLIERASQGRFRVTLLLFDVDDFKYYNDTYGHAAGDEIIRGIGQLMKGCCRSYDAVIRFGGDEFAVVFWDADKPRVSGSQHPTDALTVVDRFRIALSKHRFKRLGPDARGSLTFSGGLATFPWSAANAEELVLRADEALIAAKRQGKNRVLPIGAGWLANESQRVKEARIRTADASNDPGAAGTPAEEA